VSSESTSKCAMEIPPLPCIARQVLRRGATAQILPRVRRQPIRRAHLRPRPLTYAILRDDLPKHMPIGHAAETTASHHARESGI
jgi:hypothetical protein